jgi:hypothetical protein
MAKIGGGGFSEPTKTAEVEKSPWQKFTLALVDGNADRWFEDYDLVSVGDRYGTELAPIIDGVQMLSHAARADQKFAPSFETPEESQGELQNIPDSKFGQVILSYLKAKGVTMDYKTLWPISHEAQVELDVKHRLDGQWGTDRGTSFFQSLEIYKGADGKLCAYWFIDLMASPVPLESFNSFEIRGDDGEISTYGFSKDKAHWTVGQLSTKLQIPVFLKQLAYLSETPFPSTQIMSFSRDMAFKEVPQEARPTPFFSIKKNGLVQGYSNVLSSGLKGNRIQYDGSLFPDALQFGWRFDEESIPHLAEIMPIIVDGCTYAMTTVEDGYENYRDLDYPAPWDDVVGSPCAFMVNYETRGSRLAAPQWIPNTHIGDITSRSRDIYAEALAFRDDSERGEAIERLNTLVNDGAGPYLIHGINTMIYGFMLPNLKDQPHGISEVEFFSGQNIEQGMVDQSTNAIANLGIAYFLVGDLDRSEETLLEALERRDKFAEAEASAILNLVYEAKGDQVQAEVFRKRAEAAGGYELPEWLGGNQSQGQSEPKLPSTGIQGLSLFCSSCGNKFTSEDQRFCPQCGSKRS